MGDERETEQIIEAAEARARRAIETRDEVWQARAERASRSVDAPDLESRSAPHMPPPRTTVQDRGIIVAEGDSWFDYPGPDVLDLLEDEHGYEVEDVAHHGDRVEAMAYEDGQLMDFTRKLDKILRRGDTPKAVLLSGGGNDVTGETLGFLLNHAKAYRPGLNEHILKGTIDERLEHAYLSIISAVRAVVMFRLGRQIPILVHGYDYPVPDGRGLLGGFGFLPGPWLQPGLHARGYADPTGHQAILTQLIDRFNEMLQRLTTRFPDGDVHYVDLRGVLSNAPEVYKEWWANELHPTKKGFQAIAEKIADAIEAAAS